MFNTYRRSSDVTVHFPEWGTFKFDKDCKVWGALLDYEATDPMFIGCFIMWDEENPCGTNEFNFISHEFMGDEEILNMFIQVPTEPMFFDEFPF